MNYLFAPKLENTHPPIDISEKSFTLNYSLQNLSNYQNINKIEIRIVNFYNNKNAIVGKETLTYPTDYTLNSVIIKNSNSFQWKSGMMYKIQIRVGEQKQDGSAQMSEWSNILVLKAIFQPRIEILSKTNSRSSNTPSFQARCIFAENDYEFVEKYRYSLYFQGKRIEESKWMFSLKDVLDNYSFQTSLKDYSTYTVKYEIISNNGYYAYDEYSFMVLLIESEELKNISLIAKNSEIENKEDGMISLFLSSKSPNKIISGTYILSRSDKTSSYSKWNVLTSFTVTDLKLKETPLLLYKDFLVENGEEYSYMLQKKDGENRTPPVYSSPLSIGVYCEYSYLLEKNLQYKLKYNIKVNTIKNNQQISKINTLGSKYPIVMKDGSMDYKEFQVQGTISYNSDENNNFVREEISGSENNYYSRMNGELLYSRTNKEAWNPTAQTDENIYCETAFREEVINFLKDGKYKVFKSPSERNMIVILSNVTFTPNAQLNRMIGDFSATVYEVMEYSYDNLIKNDLIDLNKNELISMENGDYSNSSPVFGQFVIKKDDFQGKEILTEVLNHLNQKLGGSSNKTKYRLKELKYITFEGYDQNSYDGTYILDIDGQEIVVSNLVNQYIVQDNLSKISNIFILDSSTDILINYDTIVENISQNENITQWITSSTLISTSIIEENKTSQNQTYNLLEKIKKSHLINQNLALPEDDLFDLNQVTAEDIYYSSKGTYRFVYKDVLSFRITVLKGDYNYPCSFTIDGRKFVVGRSDSFNADPSVGIINNQFDIELSPHQQVQILFKSNGLISKKGEA